MQPAINTANMYYVRHMHNMDTLKYRYIMSCRYNNVCRPIMHSISYKHYSLQCWYITIQFSTLHSIYNNNIILYRPTPTHNNIFSYLGVRVTQQALGIRKTQRHEPLALTKVKRQWDAGSAERVRYPLCYRANRRLVPERIQSIDRRTANSYKL